MKKEYMMGNGAIALGALAAGVNLVAGYPGTPSSEIIETIAKHPREGLHIEWSVNEKAAMEVAASAAYSGARSLVTMKQVSIRSADVTGICRGQGGNGHCISRRSGTDILTDRTGYQKICRIRENTGI